MTKQRSLIRTLFVSISCLIFLLFLSACEPETVDTGLVVTLIADGRERAIPQTQPITVGELLRAQEIELSALDDVNPPIFTQITNGMRITVVRVTEENECEENPLAYQTRRVPNEALQSGQERLAQSGQPGREQVCYRVQIRDGVPQPRVEVSRVVVSAPQDEVIYIGPSGTIQSMPITGTLAYISSDNIWIVRGDTTNKLQLTTTNDVDQRVFSLSPDGESLIYARTTYGTDTQSTFNRLYLLNNTRNQVTPLQLLPENVLYAEWVPGQANTFSYSTGQVTTTAPGWDADNNLWLMQINPATGESVDASQLVPDSFGGFYGWWGTYFRWSPDGSQLAWSSADTTGIVDLETGDLIPLLTYPYFQTNQPWSWRSTVSFSPENDFILTTIHGLPVGSEPPATSPAFHVAVSDLEGTLNVTLAQNAGIWSTPQYAPVNTVNNASIAYLRARDLSNNVNATAAYDLVVADRDGSNARVIFPESGGAGLNANASFTWSPDGENIAFIFQGNVWVVNVNTRSANQVTLDGNASRPIWVP